MLPQTILRYLYVNLETWFVPLIFKVMFKPPLGSFEVIIDCDSTILGKIPKFCSDEDGFVELKFPIDIDLGSLNVQRIINNPIIGESIIIV